ncbi:MAG: DUF6485 family protein [Candidatus Wallbacteria bacterium]|nr:DUF6485 family protein [Candidatus Wallbacteria bacterium]
MDCKKDKNLKECNCTASCGKKGICCDCVSYHRSHKQLPACFFPTDAEATYDRSYDYFVKLVQQGRV